MKKISFVILMILAFTFCANAQGVNNNYKKSKGGNGYQNAIGLRATWGVEASYQRYLNLNNRVELDFGINPYGVDLSGMFQWMFDIPSNTPGQFKWYAGAGVGMGGWYSNSYKNGFSLGVNGQIGVEYTFHFPLLLSVDYRPGFYFMPEPIFSWAGFAVGARYCF